MNKNWRFRSGFRGKLILQRYHQWVASDAYGMSWDAGEWRDATAKDLLDYYYVLSTPRSS